MQIPSGENILIHGENLLVLKALERDYTGKIKCIYIDPPYNTGHLFDHYDDRLEHSEWLNFMRPRLEIMRRLLTEDGSIWISIDDDECHYLKVLCDEVFGRSNFIANIAWQKKYTVSNDAKWLSDDHESILVFANNKEDWKPNLFPRSEEMDRRYSNPDNHPKGPWKATPLYAKSGSVNGKRFVYTFRNGVRWSPPRGTFPRFSVESLRSMDDNNEIWFGRDEMSTPSRKTFLCDLKRQGRTCNTFWGHEDAGHNHEARSEVKAINPKNIFQTPKPERLIHRILHLATEPGDIVLDCFAGSGTTGAVAHKMKRRWIMVELGDHCHTHIVPRLKQVIDGTDQGGISKAVDWQGGGSYKILASARSC